MDTRVHIQSWIIPRVNSWTGSQYDIESWIGVTNLSLYISTWNIGLGSKFNMELWPRVTRHHWIMTRGNNSTWNNDHGSHINIQNSNSENMSSGETGLNIRTHQRTQWDGTRCPEVFVSAIGMPCPLKICMCPLAYLYKKNGSMIIRFCLIINVVRYW